jgi:hypothetical protein
MTAYGLDGPGIESMWGDEIFRTGPGDKPDSITVVIGSFLGVKWPELALINHPQPTLWLKKE